jgi:hypothetical protein
MDAPDRPSLLLLLAAPDDYLLELERTLVHAEWSASHPSGEVVVLDPRPSPSTLIRELATPSLFAPDRLLVVPDGSDLFSGKKESADAAELAAALRTLPLAGVGLIVAAVSESEPAGQLPEVFARRGEVRFLPVPPAPKPWEQARVTPAQRVVLERVIGRVAPDALANAEAVEALCERYGFAPRELAQAARRLVLVGEITAGAVRDQAGIGDCSLRDLEEALIRRDAAAATGVFATLHMGGSLLDWWDKPVDADRVGRVLSGSLARALRTALAVRAHARHAGLETELDPRRCAAPGWYPRVFKNGLFPKLSKDVETMPDSPVGGLSAWTLHRSFRLAAAYGDRELLEALGALASSGAEFLKAPQALTALAPIVAGLTSGEGASTVPA